MLEAEEGNNNIFSCGREKKVYIYMYVVSYHTNWNLPLQKEKKRRKFVT